VPGPNGREDTPIPRTIPRESTDKMTNRILDMGKDFGVAGKKKPSGEDDQLLQLFRQIRDNIGGGGNGSGPIDLKKFRTKNSIATIVIAIIAAVGTGIGGYKVLQATVADHEKRIEAHEASPMHPGTSKEMTEMKGDMKNIKEDMDHITNAQRAISVGIDELKKERVEELKEELKDERRRNRLNRNR
jgi:uncharacterized protein (DUF342 family)